MCTTGRRNQAEDPEPPTAKTRLDKNNRQPKTTHEFATARACATLSVQRAHVATVDAMLLSSLTSVLASPCLVLCAHAHANDQDIPLEALMLETGGAAETRLTPASMPMCIFLLQSPSSLLSTFNPAMQNTVLFSMCACSSCARVMLIFSVAFQFCRMTSVEYQTHSFTSGIALLARCRQLKGPPGTRAQVLLQSETKMGTPLTRKHHVVDSADKLTTPLCPREAPC